MANNVFANGLEIACKAADGKSVAAFPDPCFTPPSPPAGWIVVPYANTAYAKDTANASKTVMISGKPVMKKDVSYFKTSTGNEPAAGPKGVVTGVKKGKAYFASWSMNVKIEGKNVVRHTDGMTHNHGSTTNTGTWVYLDTDTKKQKCEKEINAVNDACKPENNKDHSGAKKKRTWKAGQEEGKRCNGLDEMPRNAEEATRHKIQASKDDCIKARKCMLVPFKETTGYYSKNSGDSRGCCGGQTGHHLIPHRFVADAGCEGYSSNRNESGCQNAPTVCVEGQNQNWGSHGDIHTNTTEAVVPQENWESGQESKVSYTSVRDGIIKAHKKTFSDSKCSPACLREQLDSHYKCTEEKLLSVTSKRMGKKPNPSPVTEEHAGALQ